LGDISPGIAAHKFRSDRAAADRFNYLFIWPSFPAFVDNRLGTCIGSETVQASTPRSLVFFDPSLVLLVFAFKPTLSLCSLGVAYLRDVGMKSICKRVDPVLLSIVESL